MMAFYEINLAVLVVVNATLLYQQRRRNVRAATALPEAGDLLETKDEKDRRGAVSRFKRDFYPAYVLIFAADWLQVYRGLAYSP